MAQAPGRYVRVCHLGLLNCQGLLLPPDGLKSFWVLFCQVYKPEDVSGEVIIELDVTWAGEQDVQLVIKPFPKIGMSLGVGKVLSNFLTMRVGVGNLFFSGR